MTIAEDHIYNPLDKDHLAEGIVQIVSGLRNAKNLEELRAAIKAHRDAKRQFRKARRKSSD
jgi:hypothetical protein